MNLPKKVRTYRDALVRSQQSSFVGREKQLFRFRRSLELAVKDELDRPIFNVSGLGGVGKSTLMRQFRQITHDLGGATAAIDETERSVPDVMGRLAEELEQQGHRLTQFSERYKVYRQRRQELESDPEAPQGFSAFLGRSAVKLARRVPGAGVVFDFVDEEIVAEQAGEWASYVARKLTNKDELRLVQEPLEILTPLFLQEIGKLAEKSALTLCFDTYERTGEFLDSWLQDLINGRYGDLSLRVLIVIAGREALDKNQWALYEGLIVRFPLSPFTDEEARQYLAQKGITDHDVIHIILKLSGHLPLLVATLATEIPDDPGQVGEPNDTAIERFLKWVDDPKRRQVAIDAALPQCLNRDILALLNGEAEAEELLEWLKQMPFVEERQDGWVYHEVVRTQMLRHKRRSSPQHWAAVHSKLADYYDGLRKALQLEEAEQQDNITWQQYTLNRLYHRLCQAPQTNLPVAINEFLAALDNQLTFAQQWVETMTKAGQDTEAPDVQQWSKQFVDGLNAYTEEHYDIAVVMFTLLLNYPNLETKWRSIAFRQRGLIHYLAEQCSQALKDLTEAIELVPEDAKHWTVRGTIHQLMEHYEDALNDLNYAIEIAPNNVWAIVQRGETYRLMERFEDALDDFNRAIELAPEFDEALAIRGETYRLMERFEDALDDFNRAIELAPDYIWALAHRGLTYLEMKCYNDALDDFNRAIEFAPEWAWTIAQRGQIYRLMHRYNDALDDFTSAVELSPDYVWAIINRGQIFQLIEHYGEAISDFTRAIELAPDLAWAIASRGKAYQAMGNYEEALNELNHAIELSPNYAWAIAQRGEMYCSIKRYNEAFNDFSCAIELSPDYAWAIAQRGEMYCSIKRYEEALADFNQAIELEPDYIWAIAQRGETYCLMKRYKEAFIDFTHAIELDPDYVWAITSRGVIYRQTKCYDEAIIEFNRAIELDPKSAWAFAERGTAYHFMKQYDKALIEFDQAIRLKPNYVMAIIQRGHTELEIKRFDEALNDFTQAIELDPDCAQAIVGRGIIYRETRCYEEALTEFNRACMLDPELAWAFTLRGQTYRWMRQYDEALNDLNRAINLNPNYDWATLQRGITYLVLNRHRDALTDFDCAIELCSTNNRHFYGRALAYYALNQPDKGKEDLDYAIQLAQQDCKKNSEDWRNMFNLAIFYLVAGQIEQSKQAYHDALNRGALLASIRIALRDLDALLTIFPNHDQAKLFRNALQKQLEYRSNST